MSLIQRVNLSIPHLPAGLEGMTIAHITDTHVKRAQQRQRRIIAELSTQKLDLLLVTGDYMCHAGDEPHAIAALEELVANVHARLGIIGVYGNHDTPALRKALERLPVRWLVNACHSFAQEGFEVLGLDLTLNHFSDSVAMVAHGAKCLTLGEPEQLRPKPLDEAYPPNPRGQPPLTDARPLRIMLAHMPTALPTAADLNIDIMFSGHTHGGQCRLPGRFALANSCDLPLRLTSGILRHRDTLAVVSRGLGEIRLPIRVFCPPQLPIYTLHRGVMRGKRSDHVKSLERW